MWKWPYQTLSGLRLPYPWPCCVHSPCPLTSHFPGSCLSLFDEEMLTLHIGALEGVRSPSCRRLPVEDDIYVYG
ncbi:hypothetical protein ACRRTK_013007 [Alexandromys fortis]